MGQIPYGTVAFVLHSLDTKAPSAQPSPGSCGLAVLWVGGGGGVK